MPRGRQPLPAALSTALPAAESADISRLVAELDALLSRLWLGTIREPLDGWLEQAARRELNMREKPFPGLALRRGGGEPGATAAVDGADDRPLPVRADAEGF
jgi:hypothetical protein